jgi:hypothetical protein
VQLIAASIQWTEKIMEKIDDSIPADVEATFPVQFRRASLLEMPPTSDSVH